MIDFLNYFTTWFTNFTLPIYNFVVRDLVLLDPLKTTNDYLIDLVNDNSLLLEKLSYLNHLTETNNILLSNIAYLLWWGLLLGFIAFCYMILKVLIYSILSALKI